MKKLNELAVGGAAGSAAVVVAAAIGSPWIMWTLAVGTALMMVTHLAVLLTLAPAAPGWAETSHYWMNERPHALLGFLYGSVAAATVYLTYLATLSR